MQTSEYTVLQGEVQHDTKVTFLKGKGWGIRIIENGKIVDEDLALTRQEIGPKIRAMLRMRDKCGCFSDMASNSRMRPSRKEQQRKLAEVQD